MVNGGGFNFEAKLALWLYILGDAKAHKKVKMQSKLKSVNVAEQRRCGVVPWGSLTKNYKRCTDL